MPRQIKQFVMTPGIESNIGQIPLLGYIGFVKSLWNENPIDMYIFEPKNQKLVISVNGYHVDTGEYVETKVIASFDIPPLKDKPKFWLKVDDYTGDPDVDGLLGTFLLPEEY